MLLDIRIGQGIGPIRFGQTIEDVRSMMREYGFACEFANSFEPRDDFDNSNIMVFYGHQGVELIQISRPLNGEHQLVLDGYDVFAHRADELVAHLCGMDEFYRTTEAQNGADFIFKSSGLHLWRDDALTEDEFQRMAFEDEEHRRDVMKSLYFQVVGLATPGYWEKLHADLGLELPL